MRMVLQGQLNARPRRFAQYNNKYYSPHGSTSSDVNIRDMQRQVCEVQSFDFSGPASRRDGMTSASQLELLERER